MSNDWEPAQQPGRAAWKTWNTAYLDREQAAREQREQRRREYQAVAAGECAHGRRELVIAGSGGRQWMGLACPAGRCQMTYLDPSRVHQDWKDSQPANPAGI